LPKSEAIFFAFPATVFSSKLYYGMAGNRLKIVYLVISATLMEHRGKTSAHAPNYENMAGNLNINF
jgi:hypothetical protein